MGPWRQARKVGSLREADLHELRPVRRLRITRPRDQTSRSPTWGRICCWIGIGQFEYHLEREVLALEGRLEVVKRVQRIEVPWDRT